jgi:hypothetical protein
VTVWAIFTKPSHLCEHAYLLFCLIHPIVHWRPNNRFAWPQSCEGFVNMAPGLQTLLTLNANPLSNEIFLPLLFSNIRPSERSFRAHGKPRLQTYCIHVLPVPSQLLNQQPPTGNKTSSSEIRLISIKLTLTFYVVILTGCVLPSKKCSVRKHVHGVILRIAKLFDIFIQEFVSMVYLCFNISFDLQTNKSVLVANIYLDIAQYLA